MLSDVLKQIDAEAIARDTLEFVRVKSETGSEGEGSRFLADLLRREGFDVTLEDVEPGRPNVYALVKGHAASSGQPAATLLFNGHTDTIPIGGSAPPARDGDWIVGRGAEDMKGGLVAMVHAVAALRRAGIRLQGDLWLTGVVGHEAPRGKKEGPRRLIDHLRRGRMHADAIVIVEGPCAIWAASLGSTIFTITLRSDRGPIHTIKISYRENPVFWLGRLLQELEAMEEGFAQGACHPLCGRERLNVGMVHGGDYPNRLPTEISVTGTRRWLPGTTVEHVRAEFQGIADRLAACSGLSISVELEAHREPFETSADHALVRALQQAGEQLDGKKPQIIGMGLVGDANLYANEAGVTTVYYGPAHETAHSDDERVSVAGLTHCAKVYALTAAAYCGVASDL